MTVTTYRARVATPLLSPTGPATRGLAAWDDGALVVRGGVVESVGPWRAPSEPGLVFDLRPALVCPGFVDAHVHAPQTRIVGSATGPLLPWLERSVFPEEAKGRDETWARGVAREFCARSLGAGTTTTCVFSSSDAGATDVLFEELDASGLRAFAGNVLMDERCPEPLRVPADRALREARELAAKWDGKDRGRLRFAVTPRFALSCSKRLLEGAAALAAELGCLVQTHVSENLDEGVATLAVHPFASDYLGVYEAVGLLGPRTVLAHAIHLSASEWDRLAAAGARVAHCPDSNFFLGSGRMPIAEPERRGVRVGLGTDVGAGRTFDLRRIAASAYDSALCLAPPRSLGVGELLRLATLGGAEALGVEAVTGSLEAGKDADFIAVDVPPSVETTEQALSALLFAADACAIRGVWIRGRRLVRG